MEQLNLILALTKGIHFGPEMLFMSLCEANPGRVAKHEVTSITWYRKGGLECEFRDLSSTSGFQPILLKVPNKLLVLPSL